MQKNYSLQESVNDLLIRKWDFWKGGINVFCKVGNGEKI